MEKEIASIQIDRSVITEIVKSKVQAAIVSELNQGNGLIGEVVAYYLNEKVGQDGIKSRYDYENKYPFLETLARQSLQGVVKIAIKEWVEENKGKIKDILFSEMKKNTKNLVTTMFTQLTEKLQSPYSIDVSINEKK